MQLTEPTTTITDLVLGFLCLWLAVRLWRGARGAGRRSARLLAGALLSTAVAAVAGAVSHGLRLYLDPRAQWLVWKLTVLSIGATSFLLLAACAYSALSPRVRRVVMLLATLKLVVYSAWMLYHDDFIWVIADHVPTMAAVLLLQAVEWRRGEASAGWIAAGTLSSLAGAGIQASGVTLHEHFNHNDLFHVVQMLSAWLLYRGGLELRDRSV